MRTRPLTDEAVEHQNHATRTDFPTSQSTPPRERSQFLRGAALTVIIMVWLCSCPEASAQGSTITYQGRLMDGAVAASGNYDVQLTLFSAASNGTQIGSRITNSPVAISDGLFVAAADFGATAFNGADRFLEIGVRKNGTGPFAILSPRQKITPAPYAVTAGNVTGQISGANLSGTYGNSLGFTNPANQFSGSFSGSGSLLTALNASNLGSGTVPDARLASNIARTNQVWSTSGNGGAAGSGFLGTIDNQPLEIRVKNQRALRIEPNLENWPNIIAGTAQNSVTSASGVVIAGGTDNSVTGAPLSVVGGGALNVIGLGSDRATIAGGSDNTIRESARHATIGGGVFNYITPNASRSTIAGGSGNLIEGGYSSIIGGNGNRVAPGAENGVVAGGYRNGIKTNSCGATIGGGASNTNGSQYGTISGGQNNLVDGSQWALIDGGVDNSINQAEAATIGGGAFNRIGTGSDRSTIAGGTDNTINDYAARSSIGGGFGNYINSNAGSSAIPGGTGNTIEGGYSAIGGGRGNHIFAGFETAVIAGGDGNQITNWAYSATIGGGASNTNGSPYGTISGGQRNLANRSQWAVLDGGVDNSINQAEAATIGGGAFNRIGTGSDRATIAGGTDNTINDYAARSSIGGGFGNYINSNAGSSAIPGGTGNTIEGGYSAIGGGRGNHIFAGFETAVIAGGDGNQITNWAYSAAIGGGRLNMVKGTYGVVPGGDQNVAGAGSLAAGHRAKATHPGCLVWADSTEADFPSSNSNLFLIRASGGVGINLTNPAAPLEVQVASGHSLQFRFDGGFVPGIKVNNTGGNAGILRLRNAMEIWPSDDSSRAGKLDLRNTAGTPTISLTASSGNVTCVSLNQTSDRNAKTGFSSIDTGDVLEKVAALQISRWQFKQDPGADHIGPMAQDFHSSFGVGPDERHITSVDADGVALAAIQGLNTKVNEQSKIIRDRDSRIAALEKTVEDLKIAVERVQATRGSAGGTESAP